MSSFAGRSCVTLENEGHLDQYRAYVFPGVAGQCLFKGALWSLLARIWNQVHGPSSSQRPFERGYLLLPEGATLALPDL